MKKSLVVMDGGALQASVPARRHMQLEGNCVLTRLLRHGYYRLPDWTDVRSLYNDLRDKITNDPDGLPLDTLIVERFGDIVLIPVDMRNTQFIAADCSPAVFPIGYEPDVLAVMDLLLEDHDTFIDVGANWGYMTLHALLRPGFQGRVIAIEPAAGPRADLKTLVEACGFEARVEILPFALSDRSEPMRISTPVWSGMASIVNVVEGEWIDVRTVDELELPPAKLIKVDIEGAEEAFLRGARRYLGKHRPEIVFECRTDSPGGDWQAALRILESMNYRCFAILVDDAAATSGVFRAVLRPVSEANRAEFPEHLNVLAVGDIGRLTTASSPV